MKNKGIKAIAILMVLFSAAMYITGCTKTQIRVNTSDDVNIVGYLDRYPDSFSLFKQILVRTETDAFLDAYGTYTCFAVTNSGVQTWLKSMNIASVDAADPKVLMDMVKFHLLSDTVTTSAFTDGKLSSITMYGAYLITGVAQNEGGSSYIINRQGFVLQPNIKVGNGIIHVINNVLRPATLSLAKQLEANPGYSIFLEAVKATGYYDLLNTINTTDSTKRWITLLAESNAALADSGINSFADLKAKYSSSGNPLSPTDTLNLYVKYHMVPDLKFLGDIILAQSQATYAPQEIITVKLIGKDVYLNDDDFNGVHEPGILLKRQTSDVQATNGVLHDAAAHFNIKFRRPFAVYWDVAEQPEFMKLPAIFRKASYPGDIRKTSVEDRPVKDVDWAYPPGNSGLGYAYSTEGVCYNDYLTIPIGVTSRPTWWELKTPLIAKGRYKVWICTRRVSVSGTISANVSIDGLAMQRPVAFNDYLPSGTDADREAIFYKRYTESTSTGFYGKLVGIVDITITDRHIVRFDALSGTTTVNVDMIHFIPVDEDQVLPRFKADGSKIYL